jgi:hypothetical protein
MKKHPFAAALSCLTLAFPAAADTFLLKDGTSLKGSILREDPTSYTLEVNVTKSIKDERVVAKADIKKITAENLDLTAFAAIEKLIPAPDLLTAADYESRIRTVEKFLIDHRGTKSKETKDILAELKAEANEILAGGIKLAGKIVPQSEYRTNAYEIDARIQAAKIRRLVGDSMHLQALREFVAFDRLFHNTSACAALAPLIKQVIPFHMTETEQALSTLDARIKERELGLQRMSPTDRPRTENAILEETAELAARFKSEKDAKLGWVTTHPFFKPSLDETMTFGKGELARWSTLKTPLLDGGKAFRDAMMLIENKGTPAAITAAITAAKTAGVAPRYLAILEAAAPPSGKASS